LVSCLLLISLLSGRSNAQCSVCENIVTIIESWVEANNTITAIEAKVDLLCQLVPAFESMCEELVDFDVKSIVGYLEKNGDATGVCKKMGVCGGLKLESPMSAKIEGSDNYCSYCEYFFGVLETIVQSGAGQDEVSDYLEIVCKIFPNEAICQFGIYNMAPVMIEYFTAVADPSTVCYDFGICDYPGEDEWHVTEDDQYDDGGDEEYDDDDWEEWDDNEDGDEDEDWSDWKRRRALLKKRNNNKNNNKNIKNNNNNRRKGNKAGQNEGAGLLKHNQAHLHPEDTCNYCSMILDSMRYYVEKDSTAQQIKTLFDSYVCGVSDNIDTVCTSIFKDFEMVLSFLADQESSQNICYKISLCEQEDSLYNYMHSKSL